MDIFGWIVIQLTTVPKMVSFCDSLLVAFIVTETNLKYDSNIIS